MKKCFFTAIMVIFCFQIVNAQIRWLTIEEAIQLQDSSPRTIIIDMYTDWCGWCKKMDAETFSNPSLAEYINRNFYPVKFNAETTDTIHFPELDFKTGKLTERKIHYVNQQLGNRSAHTLAQTLLQGRLSYPSLVFIDFENNVSPLPGYRDINSLYPILVYYTERINKVSDFGEYMACWNATYHSEADTAELFVGNVKWKEFDEVFELMQKNPKKLLIYVYSDWNESSKIMTGGAFKENVVADYINENFYAVKIPYDYKYDINIGGFKFENKGKEPQYPHEFVYAILRPDLRVPFFTIFDETAKMPLIVQRGFSSFITLEKILTYFKNDLGKNNINLQEYFNNYKSELRNKETKE